MKILAHRTQEKSPNFSNWIACLERASGLNPLKRFSPGPPLQKVKDQLTYLFSIKKVVRLTTMTYSVKGKTQLTTQNSYLNGKDKTSKTQSPGLHYVLYAEPTSWVERQALLRSLHCFLRISIPSREVMQRMGTPRPGGGDNSII